MSAAAALVLTGVDLYAGMPHSWTFSEGPGAMAIALYMWYLARSISRQP